jgi:putative membrane protein
MTYRLWYIITWPLLYWQVFLRIGCCFTDLGVATNALDAKLGCICIVFKRKMPTIFNQLQNDKLNTQPILCAYGTRVLPSFFCGSLLVILKNAVNWIYGVIGILYSHLQSC